MRPTNYIESIFYYSYSFQNYIEWLFNTYFTEWPYLVWEFFASILIITGIWTCIYLSIYTFLYFILKWRYQSIRDYVIFQYPQYLNIFIRFLPFGYIITSIVTIIRGNSYWRWFQKELFYSIVISMLYSIIFGIYYVFLRSFF